MPCMSHTKKSDRNVFVFLWHKNLQYLWIHQALNNYCYWYLQCIVSVILLWPCEKPVDYFVFLIMFERILSLIDQEIIKPSNDLWPLQLKHRTPSDKMSKCKQRECDSLACRIPAASNQVVAWIYHEWKILKMFVPVSWILGTSEWTPVGLSPIDNFFQGEFFFSKGNKTLQFFCGKYLPLSFLWCCLDFKGLVGACGISVLCSLMRVYHFIQPCRWVYVKIFRDPQHHKNVNRYKLMWGWGGLVTPFEIFLTSKFNLLGSR